LSLLHSQKN
jgi:hypothetical protein